MIGGWEGDVVGVSAVTAAKTLKGRIVGVYFFIFVWGEMQAFRFGIGSYLFAAFQRKYMNEKDDYAYYANYEENCQCLHVIILELTWSHFEDNYNISDIIGRIIF